MRPIVDDKIKEFSHQKPVTFCVLMTILLPNEGFDCSWFSRVFANKFPTFWNTPLKVMENFSLLFSVTFLSKMLEYSASRLTEYLHFDFKQGYGIETGDWAFSSILNDLIV